MPKSAVPFLTFTTFLMCAQCYKYPLLENSDIVTNYSYKSLTSVPKNLSLRTTVLDLSHNNIQSLEATDFGYLLELKVLNMSHNLITELNASVFDSNIHMEYLDLSNNMLENISSPFPDQLHHLDISSNHFKTLSFCRGLGNLLQLKYLGLGAAQILKSDFEAITHLQLQHVFIELNHLLDYQNASLLMLNTNHLHLSLLSNQTCLFDVLFDAVNTSKFLELSNFGKWEAGKEIYKKYILDIASNSRVNRLTMKKLSLPWNILVFILQAIWHSSVESLHLYDFGIQQLIFKIPFNYSNTSMKELFLHNISTEVFLFDQMNLYRLFSEMNIENLTISSCNVLFMPCPLNQSTFQYIDFSNNAITDDIFPNCLTLTKLKTLKLSGNKLQMLSKVSSMTEKMESLEYLDVSRNPLYYNNEDCHWPQSIRELNLASCSLSNSVFQCLPNNIITLNLLSNEISHVPLQITKLENLEYLNLADNRISDLPDCTLFPHLMILNVEYNQIPYPSTESIEKCLSVKLMNIGHNPFHCFCEIRKLISAEISSPGKMIGWPDAYVCERPDNLNGVKLKDFYMPEIYCNIFILVPVIIVPTILGLTIIFVLCKYFDVPWFIKMIGQWTRTKHRTRRSKRGYQELEREFAFHAFVSYSEHDASWVKNIFLPNVEDMNDSLRICQHERNFEPGKSIVENIINCIEKSYKSIFILSPHFVQSEWCHYELYFAHHKLYSENTDNLILILLEPIPQYLIPSRYYKLKALMTQRTYLEWPKEKNKHGLFWANLKAAISVNISDLEQDRSCSLPSESS
ncbi:toll-like receptor 6 [Mixophyes fleayi]|uniref:toll-like receptor 6 n=1 Tax=Mixophyes fleayi TaxID=3061075 RepID=UPI003F4DB0EC